jgi:hypothetical protein
MTKFSETQIDEIISSIPELTNDNLKRDLYNTIISEIFKHSSKDSTKTISDSIKKKIIDPILPRRFTDEELDNIIESFPYPNIIFPKIREHNRLQFKKSVKKILQKVIITPLKHNEFKEHIIQTYNKSLTEAGSAPGLIAAESMTQNVTQSTLNSFHSSGSGNKFNPVERFTRLIRASKAEKNEKKNVFVFFKDPMITKEDLEQKKREFQMLKINELVLDYEVETVDELKNRSDYWYDVYNEMFKDRDMNSTYVLRLRFNQTLLSDNRITLEKICEVLRNANEGDKDMIKCIKSPATESIIDIYMNDESLYKGKTKKIDLEVVIDQSYRTKTFIDQTLIPSLSRVNVAGMQGVKAFFPISVMITNYLSSDERVKDDLWIININDRYVLKFSFPKERIQYFLKLLNIELKSYSIDRLVVSFTPVDKKETPISRIKKRIGETQENVEDPINKYNSIVYGFVEGGEYYDIIRRDDVDPLLTHSDNPNEIFSVLGIQAVNNYLNYEFPNILGATSTEIPISSRHVNIPSLWMTNLGKVTSMTSSKIAEFDEGTNVLATIEKPFQTYKKAGIMGSYESSATVSNAICLGSCIPMGTGIVKLQYDPEKDKSLRDKIKNNEPVNIDISSLKESIGQVSDSKPSRRITQGIKIKRTLISPVEKSLSSTTIYDVDVNAKNDDVNVGVEVRSKLLEDVVDIVNDAVKDETCSIPVKKTRKRKERKLTLLSTEE